MAEYDLAARLDLRPLVLKTLLTYLELDGVLSQGTPFYAGYRIRPLTTFDDVYAPLRAARAAFLRNDRRGRPPGRIWTSVVPDDVAAALGEDRWRA